MLVLLCLCCATQANDPIVVYSETLIRLAHPELYTPADIENRLAECRRLKRTLPIASDDPRLRSYRELTELFLWFAEDTDQVPGHGDRLLLSELEDPVLIKLENQVGLSLPQSYVFLRTYRDIDSMPAPIRHVFVDQPNTRAVTFFSHYVAVLDESKTNIPTLIRLQRLQETLAHEWVHVVINSHLKQHARELPLWFHEGCAIMYSGQPGSTIVGGLTDTGAGLRMVTYQWKLPSSYAEYQRIFRYLEHRLGRDPLNTSVFTSIQKRSIVDLLNKAGVQNEKELMIAANQWQSRRDNLFWAVASGILISVVYIVWRYLPRKSQAPPEIV